MENTSTIKLAQKVVEEEFNKSFEVKIKKDNFRVAFSNDEIPTIKSYRKVDDNLIIYFVDEPSEQYIRNTTSIFNIKEGFDGTLYSASVAYDNLKEPNFGKMRREIEPLYNIIKRSTSIPEMINVEKKIKLLHAMLGIIKKASISTIQNIDKGVGDDLSLQSCEASK